MPLDKRELSQLLETAIVAARLAGQHAMEQINYVKTSVKNGTELVTQADAECQKIIIDQIKRTYPDHGFIAEEGESGALFKQPPRGHDLLWWVIDPIDGTNNFANGILVFAVSIAVMYQNEPVVGVIFDPATDSLYTAVKGSDAKLNGRRITASNNTIDEFSSIGLDSHFDDGIAQWGRYIIENTRFRNLGTTAVHYALVAKGSLIASITPSPKLWDIAAGTLICTAAGALVTDFDGNSIFPFDLENYQGQKVQAIAANKKVQSELLELLAKG